MIKKLLLASSCKYDLLECALFLCVNCLLYPYNIKFLSTLDISAYRKLARSCHPDVNKYVLFSSFILNIVYFLIPFPCLVPHCCCGQDGLDVFDYKACSLFLLKKYVLYIPKTVWTIMDVHFHLVKNVYFLIFTIIWSMLL